MHGKITGVLPALVTPYDEDGQISRERTSRLIRYTLEGGCRGFFVTGSTGECLLLSAQERKQIAEWVVQEVAGQVPVIVHVGDASTATSVELAKHAARIGADAVGSIPPIYFRVGASGMIGHYRMIGEASDLPLYVYYIPGLTGVTMSPEEFLDLLNDIPNLAGMKFTDYNFFTLNRIRDLAGERLNILSGPDEMFLAALVMGAEGAIGTTYNLLPKLFVELYNAYQSVDIERAKRCQSKANRAIALLLQYGGLPAFKVALEMRGIPCGLARRPFVPLAEETQTKLKEELEQIGFFDW